MRMPAKSPVAFGLLKIFAKAGTCDTKSGLSKNVPKWGSSTWAWLSAQSNILNSHVDNTGWQVAKLDQNRFRNHGYCAGGYSYVLYPWPPFLGDTVGYFSQSFFLGLIAGTKAGDMAGGFHPTRAGHLITASAVEPKLCTLLFENSTCKGPPKN